MKIRPAQAAGVVSKYSTKARHFRMLLRLSSEIFFSFAIGSRACQDVIASAAPMLATFLTKSTSTHHPVLFLADSVVKNRKKGTSSSGFMGLIILTCSSVRPSRNRGVSTELGMMVLTVIPLFFSSSAKLSVKPMRDALLIAYALSLDTGIFAAILPVLMIAPCCFSSMLGATA